jgi:Ca2+/Na+ antiporter
MLEQVSEAGLTLGLVLGANMTLRALWTVSSGLACWQCRAFKTHGLTMLVLMAMTFFSVYDRETWVFWLGCVLVGLWIIVVLYRAFKKY